MLRRKGRFRNPSVLSSSPRSPGHCAQGMNFSPDVNLVIVNTHSHEVSTQRGRARDVWIDHYAEQHE